MQCTKRVADLSLRIEADQIEAYMPEAYKDWNLQGIMPAFIKPTYT